MKNFFLFVFLVLMTSVTQAGEFQWKAFMTGAVVESDKQIVTDDGAGPVADFTRFTKVGLSGSIEIDEHWDGLINLVYRDYNSDVVPSPVEFALVSYRSTDNASLWRFGRFKMPTWLISDYANVGILYPWVRPPQEVYSLNPLGSLNIMSYKYSLSMEGGGLWGFEAYSGGGATDVSLSSTSRGRTSRDIKASGVNVTYNKDNFSWRATFVKANAAFTLREKVVIPGAGLGLPFDPELTVPVALDLGDVEFVSTGIRSDIGQWSIWTEYASEKAEEIIDKRASGYLTLGYRFFDNKFMPHLTYSKLLEAQMAATSTYAGFKGKQNTTTLGMNYFLSQSVVFKIEASRIQYTDGGYMLATDNTGMGGNPGVNGAPEYMSVYAASIDASF